MYHNSRDMHSCCGYNRTDSRMASKPSDVPDLAGSPARHRKTRGAGVRIHSAGFIRGEEVADRGTQEVV
jgi:hypothetical protein